MMMKKERTFCFKEEEEDDDNERKKEDKMICVLPLLAPPPHPGFTEFCPANDFDRAISLVYTSHKTLLLAGSSVE